MRLPHIAAFLIITLLPLPRAQALEMSSKRDCAICHIMWIDDFRTDKETLIPWQPGNVLMKDTQGVVSSEEICYSCHDGFVEDSRQSVWTGSWHSLFVKPSNDVSVPTMLPLSNKDELYCGTCHSAHGPGAAPEDGESGLTSFFRERNIDSSLCETCHKKQRDYERTNSHPIHTTELTVPAILFERGAKSAQHRNSVICQTCHKVHGAAGENILVLHNRDSQLCALCHADQNRVIATKHDLRVTMPKMENAKGKPVTESGPCGACHVVHNARGKNLWGRSLPAGNSASLMCLTCHGKDVPYETTRTGEYSHPVNVAKGPSTVNRDGLPLFLSNGIRNSNGNIQCLSCHNAHQWNPAFPADKGGKAVEGTSANSFLRISNDENSTLCLLCHDEKKQVVASDHNLGVTAPEEKNIQGLTVREAGPCGGCHIPHNAAGPHLWAKTLTDESAFPVQVCTGCHRTEGAAKEKIMGENDHPILIAFQDKPADLEKKLPLYANNGIRDPEGQVTCSTCHDSHVWKTGTTEFQQEYTQKNREGDGSTSFLRMTAAPSGDLCTACHPEQAFVRGTEHDLQITAPDAKNLLDETVQESGVCGTCHLAHHSPHSLNLWARPYGPVHEEGSVLDGLCTGCHGEQEMPKATTPPVATHPSDLLITNSATGAQVGRYTPVFDKEGHEALIGYFSCPSCHNTHQWDPRKKAPGAAETTEGTATTSFLRTMSYNTVCADCHGFDALFRYLYFHIPEKRGRSVRIEWPVHKGDEAL